MFCIEGTWEPTALRNHQDCVYMKPPNYSVTLALASGLCARVAELTYALANGPCPLNMSRLVLAVALSLGAVFTLQGCGGCSEDDLKKCTEAMSTGIAGSGEACAVATTWVTCVKDAGCCDDDGVKSTLSTLETQYKALGCTIGSCS